MTPKTTIDVSVKSTATCSLPARNFKENGMTLFKTLAPCLLALILAVSGCAAGNDLERQQQEALLEILSILDQTIEETEEILRNNPDPTNQYVDILDKLQAMKRIIQEVESGNAPYDPELIRRYTRKIQEIEANIRNSVDKVFSSDVFFGLGKYQISELSEEGKADLRGFVDAVMERQVRVFRSMFPDRTLVVNIKAVGYADETPLGPELAETLTGRINGPIPEDPGARKKVLNQELSYLRAESIVAYIEMESRRRLAEKNCIIGEPEIQGLGEALPYPGGYVDPPYKARDKRRRICKIYSKITLEGDVRLDHLDLDHLE